jgi:hypothetical protein
MDIAATAATRREELAEKLARVRRWLEGAGLGAALFTSQPGVAWVTAGLEDRVVRNEEPALAWALVTQSGAHLMTTTIEAARLAAEADLTGLTLHAVAWHDPGGLASVAERLAGSGGRLATDGAGPGAGRAGRAPAAAHRHRAPAAGGPRMGRGHGPGRRAARLDTSRARV